MKSLALSIALAVLAGGTVAIPAAALAASPASQKSPLPSNSVYQLDVQLTDQAGRKSAWRDKRGQPQLVSMFYTSCQYICPLIIDSGKAVQKQLDDSEREKLGVTLISMDPARDTPQALAKIATQRKLDPAQWTLASPAADDVRSVAGVLNIRYRALADGEFNHTSALVLLDGEGRILARTEKMGSKPDPEFVAAVRKALK
ncbi:SCO family protein [Novilysobacter antarcticus]|uniref:SCO family protein n=1 Tax=Novilysobacter antarcticus TaxID=2862543 RepID=UPI001C99A4E3|nr:SCO family protein [Lysobacter antarcticus]